jgi:23S rRNA (cytosine1962-C5)-methyltransferase
VEPAYDQLANRLRRVHRHLRKWARRSDVTCYRLYEKDIPDQPLIVDWYDGAAVAWAFERTRNETPEQEDAWLAAVEEAIRAGLGLAADAVFLKRRFRQKDRQEGDGQYHRLGQREAVKVVAEQGLRFEVNLSDYVDTGLFLDHRPTRAAVRAEAAGKAVLNLFAYTGAFTCYARAGGAAATTTVDLSNTYLEWAARNLALNGFAPDGRHALVRADCLEFLAAAAQRPERYDLIVCDPPTFSNSKAMARPFAVERDHPWLLERCHALLRPGGVLYFSTNFRGFRLAAAGLPPFAIEELGERSVPEDFRNRRIHACWRMVKRSPSE